MTEDVNRNLPDALARIRKRLEAVDAAEDLPGLHESVKNHYEHLEHLAISLRKLGMDEQSISGEIVQVFKQYEQALADYIKAA